MVHLDISAYVLCPAPVTVREGALPVPHRAPFGIFWVLIYNEVAAITLTTAVFEDCLELRVRRRRQAIQVVVIFGSPNYVSGRVLHDQIAKRFGVLFEAQRLSVAYLVV